MEIPVDKIKINNAVVVFFIVITCLCCPLTAIILEDYSLFLNSDLTKLLVGVSSIGCMQFAIFYVSNSLSMRLKTYVDERPIEESMKNYLLRNPLVNTCSFLILFYGVLITTGFICHSTLYQSMNIVAYVDLGLIGSTVIDYTFHMIKIKRKNKNL